jgi:hypothetical protein
MHRKARRFLEYSDVVLGIPPMSSHYKGCVELFPFLLFDQVYVDERSYKALLSGDMWSFRVSEMGATLLRDLERHGILRPVDYKEIVLPEIERIEEASEDDLNAEELPAVLRESRLIWTRFLTSRGGDFHPTKELELKITLNEIRLLEASPASAEVQRRAAIDVYDVNTMLVLSEKLGAAICDWHMYRPFYDRKMMTSVPWLKSATPADAESVHENLDIYVPVLSSLDPDEIHRIRDAQVTQSFRTYANFLRHSGPRFTPEEFLQLRRQLLALDKGPVARINVSLPSFLKPAAFTENFVRTIAREEATKLFMEHNHDRETLIQLYQVINGGTVSMGDTYNVATNVLSQQVWLDLQGQVDLSSLADELAALRKTMREKATQPEHDVALGEVASAERAARSNDGATVLERLRSAGKWAFECASEIGVSLVAEVIKKAMGIQ